ncbi:MAG: DNA translocase FtsK [Bacteroidales bacterium]|nr:DNA translocase FtsK [Bacteroidales bacterium]
MANHYIQNRQVIADKKKKKGKRKAAGKGQVSNGKTREKATATSWIHNRNVQVITGWFLLFFTIFLFVAFCSFFNTHAEDLTIANSNLFKTLHEGSASTEIGNKMGILGLYLSFLFIRYGFGIASFGFLFLFFLWSVYLIWEKSLLPLFKSFMGACLSIIWFSLLLGWAFGKNSRTDWLGGNIGNTLSEQLVTIMGQIGFLLLLIFIAIVILVIFFRMTFSRQHTSEENQEEETPDETTDEIIKPQKPGLAARVISRIREKREKAREKALEKEPQDPFKGPKHIDHTYPPKTEPAAPETPSTTPIEEKKPETTVTEKTIGPAPTQPTVIKVTEMPKEAVATEGEKITDETVETDETDIFETEVETDGDDNLTEGTAKPQRPGPDATDEEKERYLASLPPLDPRDELIHYQFPNPDLLEAYTNASRSEEERELEIMNNKVRIKKILSNFGVEIQSISAIEGPTVTMYEIVPAPGVRISKIKNLEDDIALSVAAIGIRIIAPIPGKGTVGIEVPNSQPKIVPMRDMVTSEKFLNAKKMALPIAIGRTISNEVFVFDLAKTPHVLMAGATGQGKSVGLNAVLTSLLYYKHPAELKLVLVDPKKVELTLYSKIERHYLAKLPDAADAIITDTSQVVRTLNSLCIEMDNRYELLKKAQCRNIIEYNEKYISRHLNPEHGHHFLPYIVLIFDEFADCIMTAGREVESPVARLAQLARAIGIHLIVATQRPSVNIITGVIKANFPARIAFRVSSSVDSRTILDTSGAERLIGKGDMLISLGGEVTRIQCALVDTPEIERICEYIGEQHAFINAYLLPEVPEDTEGDVQTSDDGEIDGCFADAARIVVQTGHGSTSLLQRKLKLGYNRAGRVMDQLEREGIVGAFEGSKAREVIVKDPAILENKLKEMGLA